MNATQIWKDRTRRAGRAAVVVGAVLGAAAACQTFLTPQRPNIAGIAASLDRRAAQVCAFGTQFATAYLQATTADRAALGAYITLDQTVALPKTPALLIDSAACYTATYKGGVGGRQIWTVFVATLQRPYEGAATQRGFYQVPILLSSDQPRAIDVPTARSAPGGGTDISTGYTTAVDVASPIGSLVSGFIAAYLTGAPALDRYITGDSGLSAVGGYQSAIVTTIEAASPIPEHPAGKATAQLVAHVSAATISPDVFVSYAYPLTLAAADGTWMVKAIDTTPRIAARLTLAVKETPQ